MNDIAVLTHHTSTKHLDPCALLVTADPAAIQKPLAEIGQLKRPIVYEVLYSSPIAGEATTKDDNDDGGYDDCIDYESIMFEKIEFQCKCGKPYSTEASLRFHRTECGKEKSFQCPHCAYRGRRRTTLKKHVLNKHKRDI